MFEAEMKSGAEGGPLALDYIFHPRSVAIAGLKPRDVATKPGAGGMSLNFLYALQYMPFRGPIYVINPGYQEVEGVKCYPSVTQIDGPVDHVISCVPAQFVSQLVDDCIAKGVRSLHFFTAGFKETGDREKAALESQLVAKAKEAGMRIIGPNCMGIYCPSSGLAFFPNFPRESGPVAFISQSGSHASDVVYHSSPRGVFFSKVVSYGNASDLDEAELLDYLAEDPETAIIATYIEGVKDGRRFFQALKKAAAAKPVIVHKGGRTEGGNRGAFSHTGSLAGSAQTFEAACRQAGAITVKSVAEMADLLVAFRFMKAPSGRGVAIVGGGGGPSVSAADEVNEADLLVPELPEAAQDEMRKYTPPAGTSLRNPVDGAPPGSGERDTFQIVATAENIDLLLYHAQFGWIKWTRRPSPSNPPSSPRPEGEELAARLARARDVSGKPAAVVLRLPLQVAGLEDLLLQQEACWRAGLPVFYSVPSACNAINKRMAWHNRRSESAG